MGYLQGLKGQLVHCVMRVRDKEPSILLMPPVPGGVADYARLVAQNSEGRIIAAPLEMEREYGGSTVLQYSGYGYAKRGAPLWLLHEMRVHKRAGATLGVYFHELFAFAPPWRSSFWLSPIQRHVAAELARLSSYWITNRQSSARWLKQFAGDKPFAVLPVPSNVGEGVCSPVRSNTVVVFGGRSLREATYYACGDSVIDWVRSEGFELHDVGPPMSDKRMVTKLNDAGVKFHGPMEVAQVKSLLQTSRFGIVSYPPAYLAKSGVFAAYAANGVCPIVVSARSTTQHDGLQPGVHFLEALPFRPVSDELRESVSQAVWNWYQPHRIQAHVDVVHRLEREAEYP